MTKERLQEIEQALKLVIDTYESDRCGPGETCAEERALLQELIDAVHTSS